MDKYKIQKEVSDSVDLIKAITNCNSIRAMNQLRMSVVKAKSPSILKAWQEKYWEFKK